MDGQFWTGFLQILLIDLVLSGDNAVVIGMACRGLKPSDRKRAIWYGTLGAIFLRVGFTGLITWMLDIPLVKAVAGGLLLWISLKLLFESEEEPSEVTQSRNVGQAVKTIILADFIMSLDNVLAVGGAAGGDLMLVLFGLGFSIPLLMWGSALIARLMGRFPMLVALGAAILAYTAMDMFLADPYVWKIANPYLFNQALLPVLTAVAVFLVGHFKRTGT
ncbi:MAG: TerC family protein [Clostridia bacterium]